MHFSCEKSVILREISVAHEIIASKNALSVLSNVLFDLSDDSLRICATDLKVSFETRIPVATQMPGKITVYCEKLLAILKSLPDGEVQFQQMEDESHLVITEGKGIKFTLSSIPAEKYPELPLTTGAIEFSISQKVFINMIRNTIFAISPDETRYFMNGVFMEKKAKELAMVATDGRRLSFISVSPEGDLPDFQGVIIPPKVLNLIKKLASGEGNIQLAVMNNLMSAKFDSQVITTSLIDGQFPNYARVIPEKQDHEVHINRIELLDALKRVSLLADYKSKRIFLTTEGDRIKLSSDKSEIGEAEETISGRSNEADATFALNHEYIADPIREMNNEEICMRYTTTDRSVTIVPEPETNFFHIIMPMQR